MMDKFVSFASTLFSNVNKFIPQTISSRLLSSFSVIVLLIVISGLLSFSTLRTLGGTLERIAEGAVPQMVESQTISGTATRVIGVLSDLTNAQSQEDLAAYVELLDKEKKALDAGDFSDLSQSSVSKIDEIIEGAQTIEAQVLGKLQLISQKEETLVRLERLHNSFSDAVRGKIDGLYFDIVIGAEDFSAVDQAKELISGEVNRLKLIQDLYAEVNAAYGVITGAAYLPNAALLIPTREVYVAIVERINVAQSELSAYAADKEITDFSAEFLQEIQNSDLIAVRAQEFAYEEEIASLRGKYAAVADQLRGDVESAVMLAEKETLEEAGAASSQIVSGLVTNAIIGIIALGFSVLVMLVYVKGNVIPRLTLLAERMRTLASGDLDVEVPKIQADELGQLTKAFATFKDNAIEQSRLQAERAKILEEQRAAEERDREEKRRRETRALEERAIQEKEQADLRRREVTALADQLDTSLNEILEGVGLSTNSLQTTSENMLTIAQRTADRATEGASETIRVSEILQSVATAAEELSCSVQTVSEGISQATLSARRANDEAQRVDSIVSGLLDSVGKIDGITQLIDDIAGKTNLLALNATIEAARAGESGRGFSVVAHEVKGLASQTASATSDISAQVQGLKDFAFEVAKAIEEIQQSIGSVARANDEVEASIMEQTGATQEISNHCQTVVTASQNLRTIIDGVDNAAGETDQAANSLVSNVGYLATDLSKLRQQVSSTIEDLRRSTAN